MQELPEPVLENLPERTSEQALEVEDAGVEIRSRKFRMAMVVYLILAALIWFTVGEGTFLAYGRRVEIRAVPLLIIGLFAFRTWLAREADKVRRRSQTE
ncbi:hypothetical protein ACFPT7_02955 [Acidicapsa dinghuensis]|uniref:Uncharacterized protein n=1 Tax=Acidicapsa dinghuensis TaxID=2218256 RepID=A0ABW1EA74_9BACT|nr:hypothetical protein [Acidicapsa dinghuensis]